VHCPIKLIYDATGCYKTWLVLIIDVFPTEY